MSKVLITGGTGFIGSHTINALHVAGHEVIACRRADESRPRYPLERQPKWITAQINQLQDRDFEGVDVLLHLAAAGISPQPANLETCIKFNVAASLSLMEQAVKTGVKRVVFAGTFSEFGVSGDLFPALDESIPLRPVDIYAATKAMAAIGGSTLCRLLACEFLYSRLFTVYGPGQNEKNFFPLLQAAAASGADFQMTPGEQVRDFIHVSRVAAYFCNSVTRKDLLAGVPLFENVATGKPRSLADFAKEQWELMGARGKLLIGAVPYRHNEVMRFVPATPKA